MPNWCENYLGVAGTLPRVKHFMEDARSGESHLSFQKLLPASTSHETVKLGPAERIEGVSLREASVRWWLSNSEHPAWYADRIQKWGVKWDASMWGDPCSDPPSLKTAWNCEVDEELDEDDEVVAVYHFATPWSPPDLLFDRVSKSYPDLKFRLRWVTEGPESKGVLEWVGGLKTRDESSVWEALDCLDWHH